MALTSSCCVDFKLQFIVPMHHQKTHVIARRGVSPNVAISRYNRTILLAVKSVQLFIDYTFFKQFCH